MELSRQILGEMGRQYGHIHPLIMKFSPDEKGIESLILMKRLVCFTDPYQMVEAIIRCRDWGMAPNICQEFTVSPTFDWLGEDLVRVICTGGVRDIIVRADSPLHGMLSDDENVRAETKDRIVSAVLGRELRDAVSTYDGGIAVFLDPSCTLPVFRVIISVGGDAVVDAKISCWSGVIRVPGDVPRFCGSLDIAREAVWNAFVRWHDKKQGRG